MMQLRATEAPALTSPARLDIDKLRVARPIAIGIAVFIFGSVETS
jgi:hypothetical protein